MEYQLSRAPRKARRARKIDEAMCFLATRDWVELEFLSEELTHYRFFMLLDSCYPT